MPISHPSELSSLQVSSLEPSNLYADQPSIRAVEPIRIVPPSHQESVPISHPFELIGHQNCVPISHPSEHSRHQDCVSTSHQDPASEPSSFEPFELFETSKKTAAYFQQIQLRTFSILHMHRSSSSEPSSHQHSSIPIQSKNSCVLSANSAAYFQRNQVIVQRLIIAIEPSRLELRFSRHQASSHSRNSSFVL